MAVAVALDFEVVERHPMVVEGVAELVGRLMEEGEVKIRGSFHTERSFGRSQWC